MGNSTFKETTIEDYIPIIQKEFPEATIKDVRVILTYMWRQVYKAQVSKCTVLISGQNPRVWFYMGKVFGSSLRTYRYYRMKMIMKQKWFYKHEKPAWDGYYYTALTTAEYRGFFERVGRKRKHFELHNKMCFKYKSACIATYPFNRYIVKFKYIIDRGFLFWKPIIKTDNLELAEKKDISRFADLLVSNYDYEII